MKDYDSKQVIGKLKNSEIEVDFGYMSKNFGLRKEFEQIDTAFGRLLLIIGIGGLIIISVVLLGQKDPIATLLDARTFISFLFWQFYSALIFSFYLLRDRERFSDTIVKNNLDKLRKQIKSKGYPPKIELKDYMNDEILNIFDDILKTDGKFFVEKTLGYLLENKENLSLLARLGIKVDPLKNYIETLGLTYNTHADEWMRPLLLNSFETSLNNNFVKVDAQAFLLFFIKGILKDYLLKQGVSDNEIFALEMWIKNNRDKQRFERLYKIKSALKPSSTINRAYTSRYSPTLVSFSKDYTANVMKDRFSYSIGRENELAKLIDLLSTGDKSPVLVIGAPGVGKTTFLKSLAVRMVVEDVPEVLKDKRLVAFDFTRAFAMSINIEIFKKRLQKVMEEVSAAQNIILVLDDIHNLVNIRPEYVSEVTSILYKAIDEYNIRIVCTSTQEGYSKYIKPQQSLVSLFDIVEMAEPKDEVAMQVLMDEIPRIEVKYAVKIEFEVIKAVVKLSHKYSFERVLPDKGLDLLEEVCVKAKNDKLSFVNAGIVNDVVSQKVGVNIGEVTSSEAKDLIGLETRLHNRVIGQHEAVTAVAAAMRRSRAGLSSDKKPVASFLFFGPTGVGKTELAKALAEVYFGDDKLMIRVDMSEYQEEENLSRLIGKATDNSFEGGYLTEAVRQKPFSLILLDEIEKANAKVLDLFLQVLDEGHLTDGIGRKIDFKNTIIIATSNVASKEIADLISKGQRYQDVLNTVMPKLRQYLRVEFINRFDRAILFRPLSRIDIARITKISLDKVARRLFENKGIKLMYKDLIIEQLAKLGYDPIYGARQLNRVIQERVEDQISMQILEKNLKHGDVINLERI